MSDGQEMKRRIAAKFADALLGTRAPPAGAGIGSLDEDDLLVLEGGSSASGVRFQEASLSSGIITTPVLAERRPGEVMAAGLERIRRRLSSLHGDQFLADQSRRVMNVYHEIVLLPALAMTPNVHTRREMETLAAAIDCLVEGNKARCGDL